jgi:limonene-1,2-epoxide hydrolase
MVYHMQNENTFTAQSVQDPKEVKDSTQAKHCISADAVIGQLIDLYATGVNKSNVERLGDIYAEDCVFEDPLHRIEGLTSLKTYMLNMYENVGYYEMNVTQQCVFGQRAFLNWTLTFCHPKLNHNRQIELLGISELVFEQRITFHRDYFDVGSMLYEHIPLLGRVIKRIKKQAGQ